MPTYRSLELVDIDLNRAEEQRVQVGWKRVVQSNRVHGYRSKTQGRAAREGRDIEILALSAGEIAQLESLIALTRGRLVPFWLPTWRYDLKPVSDAVSGLGTITVSSQSRYDIHGFRTAEYSRRHVFIFDTGTKTYQAMFVNSVTNNGNGTLTLVLDGTFDVTRLASNLMISFLQLVRFDTDVLTLERLSLDIVRLQAPVVEVPNEVPA